MLLFCSFSLVFQWRSGKNFLPMFTKFGRILSYHEDLPPVKSHDSLIKWSSEITWQLKIKFLLPQCLWSRRLAEWWLVLRGSCLLRSLDKLKTLHLPKGLWAPNFPGHVTKQNHYISTTTVRMTTKLGRMLNYIEQLPPINLLDPLVVLLNDHVTN